MTKHQRAIISSKIRELKRIRGKRLIDVVLLPCLGADGREVTFNPTLIFEDGTQLRFAVQESDEWEDGITPYISEVN